MAPVHNVSSFSVASTSPASSSSFSKVIKSGDFRREPSEGEDRLHSVTSKGVSFSDSLFENARERFHHKVRRILDDWDMTGGIDDSWFGKEAILRREFDPERVNEHEHSGESEENVYAAISENGDYEIRMDIVKMRLKDVRVRVSGQRRVVVEGSKLEEREMTLCRHSQRRVLYQFSLPDDAKMDAISATFSCDGTLIISIPTTKVIVYEKSGSSFEKDKQQTIHSETRNSLHYSTVAHQNVLESSQGSTMLVKEKEKESQQLCRNKNNCISEMEKSNSVFQTRASDVTCASDSSAEALISDGHLQKDGRSKEIIIPIRMVESDDIAERSQEMACSKESRECSSSSKQLSSTYRQNNHHASVGSEATLSTQAEGSIVQQRQTQKQSLAATETLSKTSNEELLLENGITMNGHRNEDHQTLTVTTTDTETSDRKTYGHRRTSRLKISDDRLNPCEKLCCDKIQLVDEMTTAWDAHDSEGHSTGSHVEGKQSHDSDEMHTKSLASDSSVTLEIREKGSFLEDLHFVSVREAMTSALHEILSKYIAVPSDDDLLGSYRQLQEQNAVKHSETLSITQEDDTHYKIVIDVCSLRRTGIAVFLRNRNEIHIVGQPLQHESDCQVSELSKCFALPEDISSVDTSTSLSSDGFLMITVVKKGNSNELATEEDNGKTGFLTAVRDDSFETRRQTLTTESSASSQSTVVHEGHLAEPHSSSQFKEKDTLTERGFSSTSDQMSTNLKNSCTSISLLGLKKELPCSTAEHESETTKSPSVLGNSISSEYSETTAFVSATDATSVEIQEEQKPNDISLLEATFIGNENSGECRENSTYTEQTEEYQQYTTGTSKGVESEKEADTSVNSLSFVDQNFDANDLESGSSVIEETSEETSSVDNCIVLNVQGKGLFDEDIFFQNIRHKLQTKEKKFLSRVRDLSSTDEDLSDEENLSLLNDQDENHTFTSIDDGDQFMIIMDVSKYLNVKEMQLEVIDSNAVLIKGSAVTDRAEYGDVKTFSKRLGLPCGIDAESAHCVISEDGVLVVAFSKVTTAVTERISMDDTSQICIGDDECPDYGGRMQCTSVEAISNIDSDSKDFMQSVRDGHRTSCDVDTSAQTKRSAEHFLSAEVNCLSGYIHDSLTAAHSTNNDTNPETTEDAFVSSTDATSVQIQEEQKPNDISLLEATYIGNENSSECCENSTYTERTEENQQYTTGTSKAVESEKETDTSVNSLSFIDQNLEANDSESALSVIEETSKETSSIDNCIVLNVQEKGLFDEDIFFQNIRHKLQTEERKFLSRGRDLSSIHDDFSDEENLSLLNDQDENQTFTSIDDGDQFMIIMHVSKYLNVKEMQLEVIDSNAVLIKGSAVTDGAEYGDVKTFSKRLGLPCGIDVESAHCVISEDGVLVVAFSKVTSAATKRISMDDTSQICIGDDECPDYGGRMQSTSVEAISNIDSDSKDFMQSMTYGHRASCGVDTSAQTERSAENNLSAEVNCLSGDIHDSPTTGHSTNNDTNPETIEDTSDVLDVGPKFDERCVGALSVQGSNENEKIHIWNTSCELGQTLQRGLDNVVNVPSFDSHKMEDSTIEDFCDTFNTETASCFIADSSLRISEKEKATSSAEETSANEKTLMKERREDDFSDSIGGNDLREMEENINTTSFKNITLSSFQAEQQRSASDYEENQVMSSRANDRMLVRKDSNESAGDLEHQNELQTFSYVAQKAVKGYFCPENYVTLKVQEKGLFAEDTFFESARRHFLVARGETLPKLASLPSVSGEPTNTKKLYCIDHLDENKVAAFIEDEQYCLIILDVSCYLEKEMVKVSVIEEKELSVEYSCAASDSELEFMNTFSTRLVLPSGIDSESGLCGISSDGILTVKFSKQKHAGCNKEERREDEGVTQHWLNEEQNLANTTNFFQNRDYISSEAKSDILVVGDSKELSNKTFSRFKIHSDSSDIQEHNSINVTMLPFIKRGHFFQDSFFTEAHRLLQVAIKRVLLQCSKGETCRHSSDIKTYKCLRKQNPTWQNQAFHAEEDQYSCNVLLDTESLSEGSTMVYVMEGTKLVIENQLQMKVGSSSLSLQTCRRSFSLPPNVDINEATSALSSDGLLYIVFSKRDIP